MTLCGLWPEIMAWRSSDHWQLDANVRQVQAACHPADQNWLHDINVRIVKLNNGINLIIIHYKGTIHENTKCEEGNKREGKGDAKIT